jgi:hypothetical protein
MVPITPIHVALLRQNIQALAEEASSSAQIPSQRSYVNMLYVQIAQLFEAALITPTRAALSLDTPTINWLRNVVAEHEGDKAITVTAERAHQLVHEIDTLTAANDKLRTQMHQMVRDAAAQANVRREPNHA